MIWPSSYCVPVSYSCGGLLGLYYSVITNYQYILGQFTHLFHRISTMLLTWQGLLRTKQTCLTHLGQLLSSICLRDPFLIHHYQACHRSTHTCIGTCMHTQVHAYMYSIHAHAPHRSTYAHRNRQVHMYIQCMHEDMHKHMAAHIHMHLSTQTSIHTN